MKNQEKTVFLMIFFDFSADSTSFFEKEGISLVEIMTIFSNFLIFSEVSNELPQTQYLFLFTELFFLSYFSLTIEVSCFLHEGQSIS